MKQGHSKMKQKCSEEAKEESKQAEISNIPVVNLTTDMSMREALRSL